MSSSKHSISFQNQAQVEQGFTSAQIACFVSLKLSGGNKSVIKPNRRLICKKEVGTTPSRGVNATNWVAFNPAYHFNFDPDPSASSST